MTLQDGKWWKWVGIQDPNYAWLFPVHFQIGKVFFLKLQLATSSDQHYHYGRFKLRQIHQKKSFFADNCTLPYYNHYEHNQISQWCANQCETSPNIAHVIYSHLITLCIPSNTMTRHGMLRRLILINKG